MTTWQMRRGAQLRAEQPGSELLPQPIADAVVGESAERLMGRER